MHIVQAVFGVFHHFELARELERRGHLEKIYSTFPWLRLRREGLPSTKVETFPWLHGSELLLGHINLLPQWAEAELGYRNALWFDSWMANRVGQCDALIAISGAGLKSGKLIQNRGGVFFCDRGSSHQRYQELIVSAEYHRWGVDRPVSDPRDTFREEEIYEAADGIVVPSTFAHRSFVEMGVPASKVYTIPYGVRLENFSKIAEPLIDTFDVLFVGSVTLRKGVPYLLEAFSRLTHPKKKLRMVGSIDPWIKSVLKNLPLDDVEFLGPVSQSRLPSLMSRSHVMVLPSIEEGMALVQGQALACGCPVIASTNTGSEDLFSDGVEGFIVAIRDVEALTTKMQLLADNSEIREQMSEAALKRVLDMGGWSDYGDRWERLLDKLVSGKSFSI
jgi:glycosyltransferase involved in cell wall biosynthesis